MPAWFPLLVTVICSLSWHWASPLTGKEHTGWSQLQPIALVRKLLLVVSVLYSLGWATYALLHTGLAKRRLSHTTSEFEEKHLHHQLIPSAVIVAGPLNRRSCLSKMKAMRRSPVCWNKVSFLCGSCGQWCPALFPELHGYITLSRLHWAAFCCVGVYWSVTAASKWLILRQIIEV